MKIVKEVMSGGDVWLKCDPDDELGAAMFKHCAGADKVREEDALKIVYLLFYHGFTCEIEGETK